MQVKNHLSCETKAGVGRTGNEARQDYILDYLPPVLLSVVSGGTERTGGGTRGFFNGLERGFGGRPGPEFSLAIILDHLSAS